MHFIDSRVSEQLQTVQLQNLIVVLYYKNVDVDFNWYFSAQVMANGMGYK